MSLTGQPDEPEDFERDSLGPRTHPSTACPECDDVSNECCPLCEGTDQYCPVCRIPAHHCEWQEDRDDKEAGHG